MGGLEVVPCDLAEANAFVARHHRHHGPVRGHKFSLAVCDAEGVTPEVVAVARAGYDERLPAGALDPARLAVLADALEEAGCTDSAILSHLRSPGPHYRGCWALDVVLGLS